MFKRIAMVCLIGLFLATMAWSQNTKPATTKPGPAPQAGQGQRPGQMAQPGQAPVQNRPAPWLRLIDMDSLVKRADLQRQKLMIENQEQLIPLQEKRREVIKQLDTLAKEGSDGKEAQVAELVQQLYLLDKDERRVQMLTQEKIRAVETQFEADQDLLFQAMIKELPADKEKVKELLKGLQANPQVPPGGPNPQSGQRKP